MTNSRVRTVWVQRSIIKLTSAPVSLSPEGVVVAGAAAPGREMFEEQEGALGAVVIERDDARDDEVGAVRERVGHQR